MSDTGYIFHCTPCGHAHAGECPPAAAAGPAHRWVAQALVDLVDLVDLQKSTCSKCGLVWSVSLMSMVSAHPNYPKPPVGPCGGEPRIGTIWHFDTQIGNWGRYHHKNETYEVVAVHNTTNGDLVEVKIVNTPTFFPSQFVPLVCWEEAGYPFKRYDRLWMIP